MKSRFCDHAQEEIMIDNIERLRYVQADDAGSSRRFRCIKSLGCGGDEWKKSGGGGMKGGKAMLGGRAMEGRGERREKDAFEEFGSRAKKGDGAIGGRDRGGFPRFKDREDKG